MVFVWSFPTPLAVEQDEPIVQIPLIGLTLLMEYSYDLDWEHFKGEADKLSYEMFGVLMIITDHCSAPREKYLVLIEIP